MEKAPEFILGRFPAVRNLLDVHMLEVINGVALETFYGSHLNY